MVTMKPPGSRPGMNSLARAPTMRPTMIIERICMDASLAPVNQQGAGQSVERSSPWGHPGRPSQSPGLAGRAVTEALRHFRGGGLYGWADEPMQLDPGRRDVTGRFRPSVAGPGPAVRRPPRA